MRILLAIISLITIVFEQCKNPEKERAKNLSTHQVQDSMMRVNKGLIKKESDDIDAYIARHQWTMVKTGTGLRYMIYEKGNGEQPKVGQSVKINYEVSLLDGTVCYTSKKTGPQEFRVGESNVESGLHEAIQLLKVGDKAKFIIPSHLAHGLIGDSEKIPPLSPIIYDVELLGVK